MIVNRARLALATVLAGGVAMMAANQIVEQEIRRIGPLPEVVAGDLSTVVVDRRGALLRAFTNSEGRWRLPVSHRDVDARYLKMLFQFEDRRFYEHGGIDGYAFLRAGWQLVRHGRIVSGASTLTMQVARLIDQRHDRSAATKWRQMLRAVQLERRFSKSEILDLYLRLAPFGGNLEGVRAAALAYFGKEPRRLSVGQAALLVALPQSPEARRPDVAGNSALPARRRVLERAVAGRVIGAAEFERAAAEALPTRRIAFAKLAAHLADAEVAGKAGRKVHALTLDRGLQASLEQLARRHAQSLGPRLSAAILVVDHRNGEVLAHVGSAGYLDDQRFGAIDMVQAVRSPGSALKPVIYGLGFDAGLIHPETLIEDRPVRFAAYRPKNFDNTFRGTVTVREALARSLNIPAVKVLDAVGPGRFIGAMQKAGIETVLPPDTEPSLATALGGLGTTLHDLTATFTAVARGGETVELVHRQHDQKGQRVGVKGPRLLSRQAAYYLTRILREAPPPPDARAGEIAFKTGTSYGYRDAWAVGFDGRHTIGVWVGRPDMASTAGLLGRTAAAPMLFDAFKRVALKRAAFAPAPDDVLRVSGGSELPPPLRRFENDIRIGVGGAFVDEPVVIAFPPDRAEVDFEHGGAVLLKAEGGVLPLTWLVNGAPVGVSRDRRQLFWQPAGEGFAKVAVVDAEGRADRVTVRLARE